MQERKKKRNATAGLSPVNPAGLGRAYIAKQDSYQEPFGLCSQPVGAYLHSFALDWKAQAKMA